MKRFASLVAAAGAVAAISAFALAGGASGAGPLPTLSIALNGTSGVTVSPTSVPAGAVNLAVTHTGKSGGHGNSFALVRLNPGVTPQQAFGAVMAHHGDLNTLTPFGSLFVSADAPNNVETVLSSGFTYLAVNTSGNGPPAAEPFTVTASSSPAALPAAAANQSSIEFGFKGPKVLHRGTIVREQNKGYLVHMIDLIGLKKKSFYPRVRRLLLSGAPQRKFRPFLNRRFVDLLNPASPGAFQQFVLNAKPGYYVEACFMDTQDGREHVQLGMERLVRVVK